MGGYASLAFSSLVPNSTVIALQPQSSVSPDICPWETRWPVAQQQDWRGPFADGALECQSSEQVIVAFDPFDEGDGKHASRIRGHNVFYVPIRFVGHKIGAVLKSSGVLKDFMTNCIEGNVTQSYCIEVSKACRNSPIYYQSLLALCRRKKKSTLGRYVIERCPFPFEENPLLWIDASRIMEEYEGNEKLEEIWKGVLAKFPRHGRTWIAYSEFLCRLGRDKEALEILNARKDYVAGPFIRQYLSRRGYSS